MERPSFELLKILVAAAESKNFYEAARKVGISQPAVSLKLKQLQSRAPLPIFALEGRRKVLTHYGRSLYEMARDQFQRLERDLESVNRSYASAEHLTLRVGARLEVFDRVLPKLLFGGRVELVQRSSHEAVQSLLEHSIDLAISYELPDSAEIVAKRVFDTESHLIVHRKWLKGKKLTQELVSGPGFLFQIPCVIYRGDGHLVRQWTERVGLDPTRLKTALVLEDWRGVQRAVDRGLGYAIVPSYIESQSATTACVSLPHDALPRYRYYALYRRELRQVGAFKRMLSQLGP